jgi:O-succinylbenzoate synthase
MRIESVELRRIAMELVEPFETSGWRESVREAIIVLLHGEGATGYGECVAGAGPWYSYETVATAWHVLREFAIPQILGQEIEDAGALQARLRRIRGHPLAKAGLEAAFWDLRGQLEKKSLAQLLGGTRSKIESGVSIGIQPSPAQLLAVIGRRLDQGYRRIKIKIKPGWDLDIIKQLRGKFPTLALMADANGAYSDRDIERLQARDDFGLLMIEQPLDYHDIVDHAKLQSRLKTPLCLDESIETVSAARTALELDACKIINIKPGRVGGLLSAQRIHDLCQAHGVPVWCGGMLETGIGRAANVALASLPNFQLPNDISASDRYWKEDLVEPPFTLNSDATLTVPTDPGLGVRVVHDRLERVTRGRERFSF